jgi:hypothetical protein
MIRHNRPARLAAGLMLSLLALTGCHQATPVASAQEASAPAAAASGRAKAMDAWQDEIIYFVLTDRFSNGNRANDFNVKPNVLNAYHGGVLDGLIKKLDYI